MGQNEYAQLKAIIDNVAADYEKASNGNRAAATRVRKAMMGVKDKAQSIRKNILDASADASADEK